MIKGQITNHVTENSIHWLIAPHTIEGNYSVLQWASGWILQEKINRPTNETRMQRFPTFQNDCLGNLFFHAL